MIIVAIIIIVLVLIFLLAVRADKKTDKFIEKMQLADSVNVFVPGVLYKDPAKKLPVEGLLYLNSRNLSFFPTANKKSSFIPFIGSLLSSAAYEEVPLFEIPVKNAQVLSAKKSKMLTQNHTVMSCTSAVQLLDLTSGQPVSVDIPMAPKEYDLPRPLLLDKLDDLKKG
jgi:hypothetical protein